MTEAMRSSNDVLIVRSLYTSTAAERRMLAGVDPIAKKAGKDHEAGARHLKLPGTLHGNARHHSQRHLRRAEANQALDEEAPAHHGQEGRYPRPHVMKRDDDACRLLIQKPVHEGAGVPLAAQEDEELRPGLGLQDVRETNDSEKDDGEDFNRSLHLSKYRDRDR